MEILTLIIKQKYFDEILAGTKTQEFREIRPNTQKKYCELDEEGYCKEEDGILIPRKYDAIRFYVGYNKDRASALVEVKDARIELFEDEITTSSSTSITVNHIWQHRSFTTWVK